MKAREMLSSAREAPEERLNVDHTRALTHAAPNENSVEKTVLGESFVSPLAFHVGERVLRFRVSNL